jgi:hypothetical protein
MMVCPSCGGEYRFSIITNGVNEDKTALVVAKGLGQNNQSNLDNLVAQLKDLEYNVITVFDTTIWGTQEETNSKSFASFIHRNISTPPTLIVAGSKGAQFTLGDLLKEQTWQNAQYIAFNGGPLTSYIFPDAAESSINVISTRDEYPFPTSIQGLDPYLAYLPTNKCVNVLLIDSGHNIDFKNNEMKHLLNATRTAVHGTYENTDSSAPGKHLG